MPVILLTSTGFTLGFALNYLFKNVNLFNELSIMCATFHNFKCYLFFSILFAVPVSYSIP